MSNLKNMIIVLLIGASSFLGNIANANYETCTSIECQNEEKNLFQEGNNNYLKGNYEEAVKNFEEYLRKFGSKNNPNQIGAENNLILLYKLLAKEYITDSEFQKAIDVLQKGLKIKPKDFSLLYNIGGFYLNIGDYENAIKYIKLAEENIEYSYDKILIEEALKRIETQKKAEETKKSLNVSDTFAAYQYYLKDLNIHNAWKKVTNNNEVIVAIIDDGIDVNHPDLVNKIWTSKTAKYGDSKVIDFSSDKTLGGFPAGTHGTMVAGIIGANRNNNIGIAGIANNVKIIPLKVFEAETGKSDTQSILKALEYAIDNGANIINLSLGGTHFTYSTQFDEIFKKAYDKGIIVVIAAGNGDILSANNAIGLNLDNNPISPVCNNNGSNKYSIGVFATNQNGQKTSWTNYGKCAKYFAPGEQIVSTTIPLFTASKEYYGTASGTSFSAPIISGIVALGFNQYGKVSPDIVQQALSESYVSKDLGNGEKGAFLDAEKYIEILGQKTGKTSNSQNVTQKVENNSMQVSTTKNITNGKELAKITFNKLKSENESLPIPQRKLAYIKMLPDLNKANLNAKGENKIMLDDLISLIQEELKK